MRRHGLFPIATSVAGLYFIAMVFAQLFPEYGLDQRRFPHVRLKAYMSEAR